MEKSFKHLINWSLSQYSDLPWRKKRTLYYTLVSEIMLQQTTVQTVLGKYNVFIKQFPNLKALSEASEEQLQIAWKGLGYYRRARNLLLAAQYLLNVHKGKIPLEREKLIMCPGIGEYTADAVMAMGADLPALAIDANIERVLSRFYGIKEPNKKKLYSKIREMIQRDQVFDYFSSRDFNEALMDLGRTYCQLRRTECLLCPLSVKCKAFKAKNIFEYPRIIDQAKKKKYCLDLLRIIIKRGDNIILYKKNENEWLSGQYELPTFCLNDSGFKQYPYLSFEYKNLNSIKTNITKYKINNYYIRLSKTEFNMLINSKRYQWYNLKHEKNLSTASLKILKKDQEES